MGRKYPRLQIRLYLAGAFILLFGLGGATLIYLTAMEDTGDAIGYEVVGGTVYSINPDDSKRYVHDLELYGGKAAVFADDLDRWFASLWHGRQLAYTLAILSIGSPPACFFAAADHLSSQSSPGQAEDQDG